MFAKLLTLNPSKTKFILLSQRQISKLNSPVLDLSLKIVPTFQMLLVILALSSIVPLSLASLICSRRIRPFPNYSSARTVLGTSVVHSKLWFVLT